MGSAATGAAVGLQVGGGLYSAFSRSSAARADAGYLEGLAELSEGNARLAELAGKRQSRAVIDAAAKDFARFRRNLKRLEGAQAAALAEKGTAGTVTAEDIARDTENQAFLDEMAIRDSADSESREILAAAGIQAFNLRSRARFNRLEAGNVRAAGRREFIGSLLGTAATVAGGFRGRPSVAPSPVRSSGFRSVNPALNLSGGRGFSRSGGFSFSQNSAFNFPLRGPGRFR